jgi:pimeloyl-ACP methyl ester carboxylesterase
MEIIAGIELPDSQWIDVDGPVHFREWAGPAEGPTFVCVHGLGGSHLNWAGVAPALSRRGRLLAPDLAGFGLTPPAGRGTDLGANWRLLHGFLEVMELGPVILVGNSMGGQLSLIQAAHSPDSVEALVLVDAAFPRARAVRAQPSVRVAGLFALYSNRRLGEWFVTSRTRRLGPERLVRETLRLISADSSTIDPRLVEAHIQMARTRQDFHYAAQAFLDAARSIFRAQVYPARYRALVGSVRCDALVLHGDKDPLVPLAAAREAAASHANWRMEVLPGAGHIPMLEAPYRCLQAIEGWLDDLRQAEVRASSDR